MRTALPGRRQGVQSLPNPFTRLCVRLHQAVHARARDVRLVAAPRSRQAVLEPCARAAGAGATDQTPPGQLPNKLIRQTERDAQLARERALRDGSPRFELAENPPLMHLVRRELRHFVPVAYSATVRVTRSKDH